jgi:peptide/nickel transport system ATP-binding protein
MTQAHAIAADATSSQRAKPLLEIRDLTVSFQRHDGRRTLAVDGIDLSIQSGQTLALVGESGSGKSVTALTILRLLTTPPARIERGSILFDGRDLLLLSSREIRQVRGSRIAMIFQEPMTSLNPVLTVGQQIVEAIMLHQGVSRRQAIDIARGAMAEVKIPNPSQRLNAYPHQFSGGMRQRVMIAMALACQPKLLLADEPTTALDVTVQAQILQLLGELRRQRGMATMLITHDLGIVAQHADVVCVLYAGRVMECATVSTLFQQPMHPYTRALLECRPTLRHRSHRLRTVQQVIDEWHSPTGLHGNPLANGNRANSGRAIVHAWWPTSRDSSIADQYRLCEVSPQHWVACRYALDAT